MGNQEGVGVTMTDVTTPPPPTRVVGDERLAYRGVFQRLFIRPEIGAAIGGIAIWIFFWAVAGKFGTAGGTSSILDIAATLGIMAVAVSMLMIGGEFDLSSGSNTGAMGILTILLVKETGELGGAGLNLWVAIPISLAVALGIGYFNGTMVERTRLPSFIVTLGTFFVLKGAKLGFSKLIVGNVEVGRIDEGGGYETWRKIFAGEWARNGHQLGARDVVYSIGILTGMALLVLATYEMHFHRRQQRSAAGAIGFAAGTIVTVVGAIVLHTTDGTGGNWFGGLVIGVGMLVALYGLGQWRYEPLTRRGQVKLTADVFKLIGTASVLLVGAIICANAFDSTSQKSLFFPFTEQGLRAVLFVALATVAVALLMIAASRARLVSPMSKLLVSALNAAVVAFLAFFIRSQSGAIKFRSELFTALLFGALLMLVWAVCGVLFVERTTHDRKAERLGHRLIVAGAVAIVVGLAVKLLFTTDSEIARGLAPAKFSVRIVWFIAFAAVATWVLGRTRFGSWTFAVGGNKEAARQVGVPAGRTKTHLFMIVSGAAWLVGMLLAFRLNSIQAGTGDGLEFEYIIAAVVGGTLLTGGYGTAIGGAIGAMIMAMSVQGIPSARWNTDWRFVFLGAILLLAVIANRSIRTRAEAARRADSGLPPDHAADAEIADGNP
jgi:ribose/xylose/arabinose/galactoside ABC-type transport system permease subunit